MQELKTYCYYCKRELNDLEEITLSYHLSCKDIFDKEKIIVHIPDFLRYQLLLPEINIWKVCYYQQPPYNHHSKIGPDDKDDIVVAIRQLYCKMQIYLVFHLIHRTIYPLCSLKCLRIWSKNFNHGHLPTIINYEISTDFEILISSFQQDLDTYATPYLVFKLFNHQVTWKFMHFIDDLEELLGRN